MKYKNTLFTKNTWFLFLPKSYFEMKKINLKKFPQIQTFLVDNFKVSVKSS